MNINLNDIIINDIEIIDEHAVPIDDEIKIKFNYEDIKKYEKDLEEIKKGL